MKLLMAPVLVAALLSANVVAAQKPKTPPPAHPGKVTAPKAPQAPQTRDFDDVRRELNRAEAELEKALRNLPEPPVPPRIDDAEIEKAIKDLDATRIREEVQRNMRDVDPAKVRREVDAQLAKVDMAAVRKDMEQALKDIEQARKDMEQARRDIEAGRQEREQAMEEMKNLRPRMEAQMKEAQEGMEKARKDLDAYEGFVNGLAADGLLNKSGYTIEHRNGKLIIDGKEQPEAVYNKHRTFLQNKEGIRISKNEKGLNIQKD